VSVDVAVIGAGLFGSIIAKSLRKLGRSVTVIDDGRPERGSGPAACLIKPSWLATFGRKDVEAALAHLDSLYGVQDLSFRVGAGLRATVHWCRPDAILGPPDIAAKVQGLRPFGREYLVTLAAPKRDIRCHVVIVAAGVWTGLLVRSVPVTGQAGMAFLWRQGKIETPFIKVWAPYKQLVAFNRGDGLWVGDGTSILWNNWNEERAAVSEKRCKQAIGTPVPPERLFGVRPYVRLGGTKPCYLEEVKPGLWVATGGAKNGTLAASWCGLRLMEALS
jgi:glycine/D-amino acid oxidase-like deaminating enzyme